MVTWRGWSPAEDKPVFIHEMGASFVFSINCLSFSIHSIVLVGFAIGI